MISKRNRIFSVLMITAVCTYYSIFIWYPADFKSSPRYKNFTLNTVGCQIPYLHPMHPSIAHLFKKTSPIMCQRNLPPFVVPGDDPLNPSVKLLSKNFQNYMSPPKCVYRRIYRLNDDESAEDVITHPIDREVVNIIDEFIKVECTDSRFTSFIDYFPFIQRKAHVEKRCQKAKTSKKSIQRLNVILLGIDSASKLQFLRHMKKTLSYMQQHVKFIELDGYNKIGQNTYPNMVAMLTGHLEPELKDVSKYYANTLPLIWNEYAKNGYRTLFSEDRPQINMFNYARKGFKNQPTDYYFRPCGIAMDNTLSIKEQINRGCINDRLETDVILKWTGDFLDVFKNDSVFALTFLSRMSHDDINDLSRQDEPYMRFIKSLKDKGHLERSIVFFFGDHGFRFGEIRSSYVGRIEGKLPFMYILVPSWFSKKFPQLYDNLQTNSHRLTSALDIYATLKDILHFTGETIETTTGRSISLISGIISENRTCEDSHISDQYCACAKVNPVSSTSEPVVKAAHKLVNTVNQITKKQRNKCLEVSFDKVKSATVEHVYLGESVENASANYQVTFQVQPSGGIFEGTVWHLADTDIYKPQTDIERVNRYGNQSFCVDIAALKPFCYCTDS